MRTWILGLIALVEVGCAVTVAGQYRYISLATQTDIRIERIGDPAIRGVAILGAFPIQWRLNREAYSLVLEVPSDTHLPALDVMGTATDGYPVRLEPPDSPNLRFESYKRFSRNNVVGIRYVWRAPESVRDKQRIRLGVYGHDSQLLGTESISFDLVTNGHYRVRVYDAP